MMESLAAQIPVAFNLINTAGVPQPMDYRPPSIETRTTNSLMAAKGSPLPYNTKFLIPTFPTYSTSQLFSFLPIEQPNKSPAPPDHISPLYTYSHSNVAPQNNRPFKCYQCPQSFNRNQDLKRHKRTHLAVKPFSCGHCEKSFSRKDALKVCSSSNLIGSSWRQLFAFFEVEIAD